MRRQFWNPKWRPSSRRWIPGICASVLLITTGCSPNSSQTTAEKTFHAGELQAQQDIRGNRAVYYVYRSVAEGETYPDTAVPLRDGGSDAVAPDRAAFIAGYNSVVSAGVLGGDQ